MWKPAHIRTSVNIKKCNSFYIQWFKRVADEMCVTQWCDAVLYKILPGYHTCFVVLRSDSGAKDAWFVLFLWEYSGYKPMYCENLMFIGLCIIVIVEERKTNLMSLAILFHLLCAQHVSDINISIFGSLRLCWWITTSVVLFSVRCVLEIWCVWFWVEACNKGTTQTQLHQISNTQQTENKTTDVVIQQHSHRLLMDILMSETCWAHKKWNKIASDIKLVFRSSTIMRIVCWWWCSWVCFKRGERNVCNKGHSFTAVCLDKMS